MLTAPSSGEINIDRVHYSFSVSCPAIQAGPHCRRCVFLIDHDTSNIRNIYYHLTDLLFFLVTELFFVCVILWSGGQFNIERGRMVLTGACKNNLFFELEATRSGHEKYLGSIHFCD